MNREEEVKYLAALDRRITSFVEPIPPCLHPHWNKILYMLIVGLGAMILVSILGDLYEDV